jgi:hypothetical protein
MSTGEPKPAVSVRQLHPQLHLPGGQQERSQRRVPLVHLRALEDGPEGDSLAEDLAGSELHGPMGMEAVYHII